MATRTTTPSAPLTSPLRHVSDSSFLLMLDSLPRSPCVLFPMLAISSFCSVSVFLSLCHLAASCHLACSLGKDIGNSNSLFCTELMEGWAKEERDLGHAQCLSRCRDSHKGEGVCCVNGGAWVGGARAQWAAPGWGTAPLHALQMPCEWRLVCCRGKNTFPQSSVEGEKRLMWEVAMVRQEIWTILCVCPACSLPHEGVGVSRRALIFLFLHSPHVG